MPYLNNKNDIYAPPNSPLADPTPSVKNPRQPDVRLCRCGHACTCPCSRNFPARRSEEDKDQWDTLSACSNTSSSDSYCRIAGDEGVERVPERNDLSYSSLRHQSLNTETLADRLVLLQQMPQRRSSWDTPFGLIPNEATFTPGAGGFTRVASFLQPMEDSIIVEPGSGLHSLEESTILDHNTGAYSHPYALEIGSTATTTGAAGSQGRAGDLLFSNMGSGFEVDCGPSYSHFIHTPLRLGFEEQFCQNMAIGHKRAI